MQGPAATPLAEKDPRSPPTPLENNVEMNRTAPPRAWCFRPCDQETTGDHLSLAEGAEAINSPTNARRKKSVNDDRHMVFVPADR